MTLLPEFSSGNWLLALLGRSSTLTSLDEAALNYGVIPSDVVRGQRLYTLFTSMFLHADLFHLGGNMLFLYVFGDNVEDAFGRGRYFIFYLLAGLAANMLFVSTGLDSTVPAIGASGAIAGVLGAYMVLYPGARILTLVFIGWVFLLPLPAIVFLGYWFIYQLLYGLLTLGVETVGGIAYWAHIGGFAAGLFFGAVWRGRRRKREF